MDILELREYCLSLPETDEATPFDETTLVWRVAGKMFALADMVEDSWINLKCDPNKAEELREEYDGDILPGWHMNKRMWNTVRTDGDLPADFIRQLIRESWLQVVAGFPRAKKTDLQRKFTEWETE